jgi:oxygen-independent coproporphyrinogen III oxidase
VFCFNPHTAPKAVQYVYMKHLYIHIPFCQRRCSYCDFNTYANMDDRIEAYVRALYGELGHRGRRIGNRGERLEAREGTRTTTPSPQPPASSLTRSDLQPTIFLGGGTPTMLSLQQMERVLEAANAIVPIDGAEVTTEANPGTVIDEAYLRGLRSLGINRISFGVQSLHDPTLRVLGRIHTAAEAIETYRQAERAGFDRINLDFIFGLPGQTCEQWAWTLDRLTEIGPEHVSLYSLIVEEGTPLHQQVTRGSITVPDDDATAAMYELAIDKLGAAGYAQYEISNWGKGEGLQARDERLGVSSSQLPASSPHLLIPRGACHHNVAYWLNADYEAAGAGAHGHRYPQRWHNILGVNEYIRAVGQGQLPIAETIAVTPNDLLGETMMMGLRLSSGVSFAHFADRCGAPLLDVYGDEVRDLRELGLLVQDETGVRLTERGRMLGNEVFLRFLRDAPALVEGDVR